MVIYWTSREPPQLEEGPLFGFDIALVPVPCQSSSSLNAMLSFPTLARIGNCRTARWHVRASSSLRDVLSLLGLEDGAGLIYFYGVPCAFGDLDTVCAILGTESDTVELLKHATLNLLEKNNIETTFNTESCLVCVFMTVNGYRCVWFQHIQHPLTLVFRSGS